MGSSRSFQVFGGGSRSFFRTFSLYKFVTIQGAKQVHNTDAPLVIFKRLDRSVFGYTFDAVGWALTAIGSLMESEEPDPLALGIAPGTFP